METDPEMETEIQRKWGENETEKVRQRQKGGKNKERWGRDGEPNRQRKKDTE